ncbi:iron-sulfur cluster assembly scaffold protein [candidate division WWE3 bacterium]|uniref:Iron-sulfur cluster assembly scaffold protein n=1 Tax=candidate division WWE3 bacterium TaxID=2053526 RepID=A0A7X9E748_UNCKA|nr:iron-sulfur cluster assembly scaffold protein [candidate division WWE3 bacterium]
MYTDKVLKYFHKPRNLGKIKNADGIGKVGNLACGDMMYLYIKVENIKGKEVITNVKFQTFGCVAAIATSSAITEMVKGKTIEEALKVTNDEIIESLDGLPPIKIHCSVLATEALAEAIYDYLKKSNKPTPKDLEKKHESIVRHNEELEERYEEWMENQKE